MFSLQIFGVLPFIFVNTYNLQLEDKILLENTEFNPEIYKRIEKTLKSFSSGFLENIREPSSGIEYYTQSSDMLVGFGVGYVKVAIKLHKEINIQEDLDNKLSYDQEKIEGKSVIASSLIEFLNCNPVVPIAENPNGAQANFFIGNNHSKWRCLPFYEFITFYNLYDHIDLRYMIKNGQLKYEFYVYPGGNVDDITIRWKGPISINLLHNSINIKIKSSMQEIDIIDSKPVCYQSFLRNKVITSQFQILNNNTYGFRIPNYDKSQLLIIDPTLLAYSTFIGGTGNDNAFAIDLDSEGNVYITGYTSSTNFPVENEYEQDDGQADVIVTKLNATGNGLIYSTYVGGSANEVGSAISLDQNNNAYVTGYTVSDDFPLENEYDSTINGIDIFVFKLNSNGNNLEYSTYIGGNEEFHEEGFGIAVDTTGCAYVTGETDATDASFPMSNAFQERENTSDVGCDAFVLKLSPTGNYLIYSSYLGGSKADRGYAIAVDSDGNAYITGETKSNDFLTTSGTYDDGNGDGWNTYYDVFVSKVGWDGFNSELLKSTYVSGTDMFGDTEVGRGIAVDDNGYVYVTGYTDGVDWPTKNAYDPTGDAVYDDVFVFKLNPDFDDFEYSTYIAGNHRDYGRSIAIDSVGNAYVTGYTYSTVFPAVNAINNTGDQSTSYYDIFVCKLNAAGDNLLYSTFISGSVSDRAFDIAVDPYDTAYVCGITDSSDFPKKNAYAGKSTSTDVVVFAIDTNAPNLNSPNDLVYDEGDTGIFIDWEANDSIPSYYSIEKDSIEVQSGSWSSEIPISINIDGLFQGIYNYTIIIWDQAGHSNSDTVNVTVMENRYITWSEEILNLKDGITNKSEWIWEPRDTNALSMELWLNDQSQGKKTSSLRWTLSLVEGSNNITIIAYYNIAEQITFKQVFLIECDTIAPTITLVSPSEYSVCQSLTSITIGLPNDVDKLYYSWDDSSYMLTNDMAFTLPTPDGTHRLNIKAIDNAGNIRIDHFSFTTDDTPPTGEIHGITDYGTVSGIKDVRVVPYDVNDIEYVAFYIDNQLMLKETTSTTSGYIWKWNTNDVSNGEHQVSIEIVDIAGNIYTKSFSIKVNNIGDNGLFKEFWIQIIAGGIVTVVGGVLLFFITRKISGKG